MNNRLLFLTSFALIGLCPISACKSKADAPQTNDKTTEAPATPEVQVADAQPVQPTAQPDQAPQTAEVVQTQPSLQQPAKLNWKIAPGLVELDGIPTCVKPTCQCGGKTIQQYELCINDNPAKKCLDDKCICGDIGYGKNGYDESIGVSPIPVNTYCINDSELWCGNTPSEKAVDMEELYHYLCHNGHWQYSMDPVDRSGFDNIKDENEAPKAPDIKLSHVTVCKDGNCKCGDGECGKNAICINDKCYCGNIDQLMGGTALTEATRQIDTEEGSEITIIESNEFGDFECRWTNNASEARAEYHAYYYCGHADGCATSVTKAAFPHESCSDGKSYLGPTQNEFFAETDFTECKIDKKPNSDQAALNLQSNIETSSMESSITKAAMANLLNLCGRDSSANMKQDHSDYDAFYNTFKPSLQVASRTKYDAFEWNHSTAFFMLYNADHPDFNCNVRRVCDTWPVPRDKRSQYVCDISADSEIYMQFKGPAWDIGNDNDDYYKFAPSPKGLRCIDPNGCVCDKTICANQSICKADKCIYDHKYIRNVCGLTPIMKSQQEIESEIKRMLNSQNPSGRAWDLPHKYLQMLTDTTGLSVSNDGACICGHSELRSPDLSQYTCDLIGYRCTSDKGCACGSVLCPNHSYCLKPDVCAVE